MLLNRKIILFLCLALVIYLAVDYLVMDAFVVDSFTAIEQQAAVDNAGRVARALEARLDELSMLAADYTLAHQLGDAIQGSRDRPLDKANLLRQVGLNMSLLYDAAGRLVCFTGIDSAGRPIKGLAQLFQQAPAADDALLRHATADSKIRGLINTRLGPMLIVSQPVLEGGAMDGVIEGVLLLGMLLDERLVATIARQINVHFTLSTEAPAAASLQGDALPEDAPQIKVQAGQLLEVKKDALNAHVQRRDVYGGPGIWIKTVTPRSLSAAAAEAVDLAFFAQLIQNFMLLLLIWFFLDFFVVGRIKRLTGHIGMIERKGDLSMRTGSASRDEIGSLSRKFDRLIAQLEKTRGELEGARDNALALSSVKSDFLATMSHEIRTPLNGMLAFAELLRDAELTAEQRRYAELIHSSGESLLDIISDVLDFSKIEAGKVELERVDFDLRRLVEEVSEILALRAFAKGLDLVQVIPHDLNERVRGDPTRLRQVLINLLGNAIKFTEHGQVVIRVSTKKISGADELRARFQIEDTGIGIVADQQRTIFDAFTQEDGSTARRFGGSGLGLAISQQLVSKMGGRILVRSRPGAGSLFWFTVRLERTETTDSKTRIPTAYLRGKQALVVDDNQTNLHALTAQLNNWRIETDSFSDALAALSALRNGEPPAYDVLLIDKRLQTMDGLALIKQLRQLPAVQAAPALLLSSSLAATPAEQARALKITHVLQKPVRQADLYKSLSEALVQDSGNAPAAHGPKYGQGIQAAAHHKVKFRARVLVVEDNLMNQQVATAVLQKCGCSVALASNGQEAVHLWVHDEFDIILMDLRMPVMDGFAAAAAIREQERERQEASPVPIIALTADVVREVKQRVSIAGMNGYLPKPFTQRMLTDMFSEHIPQLRYGQAADEQDQAQNNAGDNAQDKPQDETVDNKPDAGDAQFTAVSAHIDMAAIEALRELVEPDDDDNVVVDMIESYLKSSARLMQSVSDFQSELGDEPDLKSLAEAAHSLQSSSGYLGAQRLVELCKQINAACKAGDAEAAGPLCRSMQQEYGQVLIALGELKAAEQAAREDGAVLTP